MCINCVSMNDSVLWVLLLNMIHKGCLPDLPMFTGCNFFCTFSRSSAMLLVDVICISLATELFTVSFVLLLFLLREPITTLLSQRHHASGPHCFTYCVTCHWCLEGGIRSDADVARMRQLLRETADIKLWHEERKASYFQTTFGLHKSCCMAGCKVFASCTW